MQPIFEQTPLKVCFPTEINFIAVEFSASTETPVNRSFSSLKALRVAFLFKRLFDILFSVIIMIACCPLFFVLLLITKFSSDGPVFYRQERLGRYGKPFFIHKFRSMYANAEKSGPQLSYISDPRITKWGRVMRQMRLDELPQFWNVLMGEMSIVGPRPERLYFAQKIVLIDPRYSQLLLLKPGLTSLAQVKFGYAENVKEMCVRMKYDLFYLRNANPLFDLRIICMTVKVILQKKGK